ncbi:MAG: glycosyltransferase family 2 protein [Mucinivorans sp.]
MNYQGKISVCMPTYNGGKYIKEQLESILIQLGSNDEVVISDDRSTDDTIEILDSFKDNRIKVFTHEKVENHYKRTYTNIYYVYKNVENALAHAQGEYIFLSDQDDIWLPNKVERMMEEFGKGAQCVLHNTKVVNNNMETLMESYFDFSRPSHSLVRLLARPFYQGASMAFTRKVKEASLPFPNKFVVSHDHWIACIARTGRMEIEFIDQPLLWYRRHGNNVSPSSEKSPNSLYFKISYRFNMVINYLVAKSRFQQ